MQSLKDRATVLNLSLVITKPSGFFLALGFHGTSILIMSQPPFSWAGWSGYLFLVTKRSINGGDETGEEMGVLRGTMSWGV